MALDLKKHPCFNGDIKHKFGRIHLPVAPKCNIQCNFCNRKYDCVNESRPGVTCDVLTPQQSVDYLNKVLKKTPNIKVVGIAGPGDPFANPDETLETLRLIRKEHPGMLLCLASNGLNVEPYVQEMKDLDVSHVTITCCGVRPEISSQVYAWIRHNKKVYRGLEAGKIMLENQLKAIKACKAVGLTVKVNMIIIPGVNDDHVSEVAKVMGDLNVDLFNCMGLCHVPETPFETIIPPSDDEMKAIRAQAGLFLPQMHHCTRCRADAVGLLDEDMSEETFDLLQSSASGPLDPSTSRPYVAVSSLEGQLINQHLGEAKHVWVFGQTNDGGYKLIENRKTPAPGNGDQRWADLGDVLKDCRALLVSEAGDSPRNVLAKKGVRVYRTEGIIRHALEKIYNGEKIKTVSGPTKCGSGCSGNGMGCS